MHLWKLAALVTFVLAPLGAAAQDFDAGVAAYDSGYYATALREFRPMAEAGNAVAQYALGIMYDAGEGVVQDDAEAVRWYRLAAEQGVAGAQSNLGVMYDAGRGVVQDDAEAVRWYRLAAEQGNAMAQYNLALMYLLGRGVIQDDLSAHIWFNIAGANGNEGARKNRDLVRKRMTPAYISTATQRAKVCMASEYNDCD